MRFRRSIFVSKMGRLGLVKNLIILIVRDGTTDVTRTWHFGTPSTHQMECFTRVLKGQINMGTAVFPNKIKVKILFSQRCLNMPMKSIRYREIC